MLWLAVALCVTLIATAVVLVARKQIPSAFAFGLCLIAVALLWVLPKAGTDFKAELKPGGLSLETLVARAENAASSAMASKEEVTRLAEKVQRSAAAIVTIQRRFLEQEKSDVEAELGKVNERQYQRHSRLEEMKQSLSQNPKDENLRNEVEDVEYSAGLAKEEIENLNSRLGQIEERLNTLRSAESADAIQPDAVAR